MTDKTVLEEELDLLPLKWPRERIRKYLSYLLMGIALLAAAAVITLLILELAPAFLGLAVVIGASAIVATAVVFLADWWYERNNFFRINASRHIDEAQKTATITLNAAPNRFSFFGLWGSKQKDKYEFSWNSLLKEIDTKNKSGTRKSSFEIRHENSLIAQALAAIKSWGGFDESENQSEENSLPAASINPIDPTQLKLTSFLTIDTVQVIVNVDSGLNSTDALALHVKGIRTLLADFLNQEMPLSTVHYEIRQNNNCLLGLTFQKNAALNGYDLVLNSAEVSQPGVAQAIRRLLQKSLLSDCLLGIRGLTAVTHDTMTPADINAHKKLCTNYFTYKHATQDYMHTPKLTPSRKPVGFFTYIWQGLRSLFSPARYFDNRQDRSHPGLGDDGAITAATPLACEVLVGDHSSLKDKLAKLFAGYTQEINESLDYHKGLTVIRGFIQEVDKIRKQRLLKDTPRTHEAASQSTFDADQINVAYSVFVHAILAQGIYGEALLQVRMPPPGTELEQNPQQREWALAKIRVVDAYVEKTKQESAQLKQESAQLQQETKAARERRLAAEQKIQEILGGPATTVDGAASSSSSAENPPVSMSSSILPGLALASGSSSRSTSPIPTSASSTADIDSDADAKEKAGSVYSATM